MVTQSDKIITIDGFTRLQNGGVTETGNAQKSK
jgi:hypothetical protein